MARIDPLSREELPQYRELFDVTEDFMGVVPNSLLTMARVPRLFEPFMEWAAKVLVPTEVDPGLAELVAYVTSNASGCRYCQAHTSTHAAHLGVDREKVVHAFEFETSGLFDESERAAFRLAAAAGLSPNEATDAHFDELKRHFSNTAVIEIVAVIAFFGHMNRWNDTMATTLEEVPRTFAQEQLADAGWDVGRHT